jgi:hypothetical protein
MKRTAIRFLLAAAIVMYGWLTAPPWSQCDHPWRLLGECY